MNTRVSIIVPCRTIDEAEDCYRGCAALEYDNYEVLLLPDTEGERIGSCQVIPTGAILPSAKRDVGIKNATGEIIAFIDADAYPSKYWLKDAVAVMQRCEHLAGVCGPGILPPGSSARHKAADIILRMLPFNYRVMHDSTRYVDDYPTFNLILWKKYIDQVGGFNCNQYLTGEDTILCKKIVYQTSKKILYTPEVFVYHERRPLFRPFLKQLATYGKHRGFFLSGIRKQAGS